MYRKTFAEINLDNLEHNISVLRDGFSADTFFCPMVKANAYGHGDVQVAKCLELMGVKSVGVCLIEEGLLLRNYNYSSEILVFRGFDLAGARRIVAENMTPVVSSWRHLQYLEEIADRPIDVHVKFDTGMNRLGFLASEAEALVKSFWQNKKIRAKGVVTHLLEGEDAKNESARSAKQLVEFAKVYSSFQSLGVTPHALNSAGILNKLEMIKTKNISAQHPLFKHNWGARPGLAVYGYDPVERELDFNLKPVLSLKSIVPVIRTLSPGETVSYGGTFKAQRKSYIGVIPIGYADGYHRILSNNGAALFAGQRVPVVGTVCMDYMMVDLTDVIGDKPSESFLDKEIIIWGQDEMGVSLSANELARNAKTITWEMLTSIGERVPRVLKGSRSQSVLEQIA